jgi:uncharacterized protein (TIGR02996 family)
MSDEDAFIVSILNASGDDSSRLVYADWLQDRDDPRERFLRAEAEAARKAPKGKLSARAVSRLRRLSARLDPVWVARISRPPIGVCCDHLPLGPVPFAETEESVDRILAEKNLVLPSAYRAFLLNYNHWLSLNESHPNCGHAKVSARWLPPSPLWFFPLMPQSARDWSLTYQVHPREIAEGPEFLEGDGPPGLEIGAVGDAEGYLLLCIGGKDCGVPFRFHVGWERCEVFGPSFPGFLSCLLPPV